MKVSEFVRRWGGDCGAEEDALMCFLFYIVPVSCIMSLHQSQ